MFSYIEENHAFKLAQWQAQRSQPAKKGAPSQDLMSFWGSHLPLENATLASLITLTKVINSKHCHYYRIHGQKHHAITSKTARFMLSTIILSIARSSRQDLVRYGWCWEAKLMRVDDSNRMVLFFCH